MRCLTGRRHTNYPPRLIHPHHIRMDTSADPATQTEDDATAQATRRLTVRGYADHIALPRNRSRFLRHIRAL